MLAKNLCRVCHEPLESGRHAITAPESETLPAEQCPKCSGGGDDDWRVKCVSATHYHFQCSCGITWRTARWK
jgi:hypothetical protein